MTDVELLHKWMNDPRVAASWGEQGPVSHQEAFLKTGLTTRHSFPVIGSFDGKPFAYFEIYWVKEDRLGGYIGGDGVGEWDRGLHVLVGEQDFRGPHRIRVWLSALVHYCLLADARTSAVFMEPRVDNVK
jgi:RimJ/RimL family protein N-acetyltransferase